VKRKQIRLKQGRLKQGRLKQGRLKQGRLEQSTLEQGTREQGMVERGLRQSMAWLHTWTGLLAVWLLFLIFLAGTASYYRDEINRWMRPELPRVQVDAVSAVNTAVRYLQQHASDAQNWYITLPDARSDALYLYWTKPDTDNPNASREDQFGTATLSALGDKSTVRDTLGGDFFYRVHFDLHYIPVVWARYIVGFCAMFMLVAIISGVITHKKIFIDFFTFRPGKGQRSWLDFHNISAVMGLPYHAMITYTGIVTLMFMYLPWGIQARYGEDSDRFYAETTSFIDEVRPAAGHPGPMLPMAQLLQLAGRQWPGVALRAVQVQHPNDANAVLVVQEHTGRKLSPYGASMALDATTGAVLKRSGEPDGARVTHDVMIGLHLARFASQPLRLLFFVSGLLGCLMVATGAILWAVKRRPHHLKTGRTGFSLRLVDALNIGSIAGLPIAFASYFLANRLLPLQLDERAEREILVFFLTWLAALLAAFIYPKRAMWTAQLYAGAIAFWLVPIVNGLTTQRHLIASIGAGDWPLAGVDLMCIVLGLGLGLAGWRLQCWKAPATRKRASSAVAPLPRSQARTQASA